MLYTDYIVEISKKTFWDSFSDSAFKTTTMVNFSSGWVLTGQKYLDWASNEKLSTSKFAVKVMLPYTPFVPPVYLKKECTERMVVVDSISGLSMLESLAKNLKSDPPAHTAVQAISRHYCSLFADNTLRWYITKNDVRKIVLQGSQSPYASLLLQSNMWEPTVFGKEALDDLIKSDNPKMGILKRLQLSDETNKRFFRNPSSVDPEKLGFKKPNPQNEFFREQNNTTNQSQWNKPSANQQNSNKMQSHNNNQNKWGDKNQKAGYNRPTHKKGPQNKKKQWQKQNQNQNGNSGFSGMSKGKNNSQQ